MGSGQGPTDFSNPNSKSSQSFQNNAKRPSQSNNSRPSDQPKLYDVKCSNCGKDTKVIFPPEPGRAVYCKNCLKKMSPSGRSPAGGKEQQGGGVQQKSNSQPKESPVITKQVEQSRMSGNNSALADMGIEFTPPSDQPPSRPVMRRDSMTERPKPSQQKEKSFSLNEIMEKGEVVSFSNSKKDKQAQKTPRKSVDLDDLRKTLEESLASKSKSSEEELEERIEEEKDADKVSGDE